MPRIPTSDENAEAAVYSFLADAATNNYGTDRIWLGIVKLLLTCEVWNSEWTPFMGQPVFLERNDYKLLQSGNPNTALRRATEQGDYIAAALGVEREALCASLGLYLKERAVQPNNPRGHAFRSIISGALAHFGDPGLTIEEEVDPYILFPGATFPMRSEKPRIDIVIHRGPQLVGLCSVRWSYRHDRVDMLEEASAYMQPAHRVNQTCRFFGITSEMNPARLDKVLSQTSPVRRNAAMTALVHLHSPLAAIGVAGHENNQYLMDLSDWIADSWNW